MSDEKRETVYRKWEAEDGSRETGEGSKEMGDERRLMLLFWLTICTVCFPQQINSF